MTDRLASPVFLALFLLISMVCGATSADAQEDAWANWGAQVDVEQARNEEKIARLETSRETLGRVETTLERLEFSADTADLLTDIYQTSGKLAEIAGAAKKYTKHFGRFATALRFIGEGLEIWQGYLENGFAGVGRELTGLVVNTAGSVLVNAGCAALGVASVPALGPGAIVIYGGCLFLGGVAVDFAESVVEGLYDKIGRLFSGSQNNNRPRQGRSQNIRATNGSGTVRTGNDDIDVETGDVTNTVTGRNATGIVDVGVARGNGGGNVEIDVNADEITNTADGNNATAAIGLGVDQSSSGDVNIEADVGTISNIAGSNATSITDIGVSTGGSGAVDIDVQAGDVNNGAAAGGHAVIEMGTTHNGGTVRVRANDVINDAGTGETATVVIGAATDGGRSNVSIGGDVVNRGNSSVTIGAADGGNVNVHIRGGTITSGGTTNVGVDNSVFVGGDVINKSGNLGVGGKGCVGHRNGKCCLKFNRGLCAISITPPGKHGCAPRYEFDRGSCYLYTDRRHRVNQW